MTKKEEVKLQEGEKQGSQSKKCLNCDASNMFEQIAVRRLRQSWRAQKEDRSMVRLRDLGFSKRHKRKRDKDRGQTYMAALSGEDPPRPDGKPRRQPRWRAAGSVRRKQAAMKNTSGSAARAGKNHNEKKD